jgi:hypothetical protein
LKEEIDLTSNFEIYINNIYLLFDIDRTVMNLRNPIFLIILLFLLHNIKTNFISSSEFDDINLSAKISHILILIYLI